jgi:hypothetical protein
MEMEFEMPLRFEGRKAKAPFFGAGSSGGTFRIQ